MAEERFRAEGLRKLLTAQKVATMADLKEALGTDVDMTVFRKLRELSYLTSYSHRSSYYSLTDVADFDALGLWSFRSVWFSKFGTLVATAEACPQCRWAPDHARGGLIDTTSRSRRDGHDLEDGLWLSRSGSASTAARSFR